MKMFLLTFVDSEGTESVVEIPANSSKQLDYVSLVPELQLVSVEQTVHNVCDCNL